MRWFFLNHYRLLSKEVNYLKCFFGQIMLLMLQGITLPIENSFSFFKFEDLISEVQGKQNHKGLKKGEYKAILFGSGVCLSILPNCQTGQRPLQYQSLILPIRNRQ
jgi:hypothetical protein